MTLAFAVALRGDCRRRQVGAVILDVQHRVIATGYNGVRPGAPGCLAGFCPRGMHTYGQVAGHSDYDKPGPGYCIATHAEMNAVLSAAPFDLKDATLYVTIRPCEWCFKQIRNTRMYQVVFPAEAMRPEQFFSGLAGTDGFLEYLKLEHKLLY